MSTTKIRLHGTPEDVQHIAELLNDTPQLRILNESGLYKDRAPSKYVRHYIDVEPQQVRCIACDRVIADDEAILKKGRNHAHVECVLKDQSNEYADQSIMTVSVIKGLAAMLPETDEADRT